MGEIELITIKLKAQLGKFYNLVEYLNIRVMAWQNYSKILDSNKLLYQFNRKWSAYRKAREIWYLLAQNIERFELEKPHVLDYLKINNPRLWKEVEKFEPVRETTSPLLSTLLSILNKDKETVKSYIKTDFNGLLAWVGSLEDASLKDKLAALIIEISGGEIDELNKCINDLKRWKDFRIGNDIMFFYNRVLVYLKGGRLGRLPDENFFGLAKRFKDYNVVSDIKESNALKRILSYPRLVGIFMKVKKILEEILQPQSIRPNWEGFLIKGFSGEEFLGDGFYSNLTKGKNFIKKIKEDFGYEDITDSVADKLEAMYKTKNQDPSYWLKNLDWLIRNRITHPTIQNFYVIVPVVNDLTRIFEKRKGELSFDIGPKIDRLHYLVQNNFEKSIKKSRNLSAFESILSKEIRLLKREIEEEKSELRALLLNSGDVVINFVNFANELIASNGEEMHQKIVAFLKLKMLELQTLRGTRIKKLDDDPKYAVGLYSSLLRSDKRVEEINKWVALVKLSGLNALKYELSEIESGLERENELRSSSSLIDRQLDSISNYYFTLRKNGKYVTILYPEYLSIEENFNLKNPMESDINAKR